jgi:hypothetical protein
MPEIPQDDHETDAAETAAEAHDLSPDFAAWLVSERGGQFLREVNESFGALLDDVESIGKKGTMRLTLAVDPRTDQLVPAFDITPDVEIKSPRADRWQSLYFRHKDGSVSRQDPTAQALPGMGTDDA